MYLNVYIYIYTHIYMAVTKVPLRFESCDVEESQIVLDVSYMFRAPSPLES